MNEDECLELIESGESSAYDLLHEADSKLIARFERADKAIVKLLADVKRHFPDATYYTASGGFNLLLGNSHSSGGDIPYGDLVACSGSAEIGDGDF